MATGLDWVEETRDHLEGASGGEANQLDDDYVAGSGQVTLRHPLGNISTNSVLSMGPNTMRVFTTNTTAKTATVVAGYQGSVDLSAPAGTMVRVNPRFTDYRIFRQLNAALNSLSSPRSGLFAVRTALIDYEAAIQGYDLGGFANVLRVLEVRREVRGTSDAWPRVRPTQWDLLESAPLDIFPSGQAVRVMEGDEGLRVQIVMATAYVPLQDPQDDVADYTGVSTPAADIPPLVAACRLMSGKEVSRNLTAGQGDSRKASEVPPGAVANSYRGLLGLASARIQEEASRLAALYPVGI